VTLNEHLKAEWTHGYDSGDILRRLPDRRRRHEEQAIGGSYRRFFVRAVKPHLDASSTVMELGPGRGSWTRALLATVPRGKVHTIDYVDVSRWLPPEQYGGRLESHLVEDNSFSCVADGTFDFFFSFGVLCHTRAHDIAEILRNALAKVRPGAVAVHEYADWRKLDRLGWDEARHGVPAVIRDLPDDHEGNWWPKNDPDAMAALCRDAGWIVEAADLGYFERDSVIRLRAPG
jgi:SAM-dependent methyltransferase